MAFPWKKKKVSVDSPKFKKEEVEKTARKLAEDMTIAPEQYITSAGAIGMLERMHKAEFGYDPATPRYPSFTQPLFVPFTHIPKKEEDSMSMNNFALLVDLYNSGGSSNRIAHALLEAVAHWFHQDSRAVENFFVAVACPHHFGLTSHRHCTRDERPRIGDSNGRCRECWGAGNRGEGYRPAYRGGDIRFGTSSLDVIREESARRADLHEHERRLRREMDMQARSMQELSMQMEGPLTPPQQPTVHWRGEAAPPEKSKEEDVNPHSSEPSATEALNYVVRLIDEDHNKRANALDQRTRTLIQAAHTAFEAKDLMDSSVTDTVKADLDEILNSGPPEVIDLKRTILDLITEFDHSSVKDLRSSIDAIWAHVPKKKKSSKKE